MCSSGLFSPMVVYVCITHRGLILSNHVQTGDGALMQLTRC